MDCSPFCRYIKSAIMACRVIPPFPAFQIPSILSHPPPWFSKQTSQSAPTWRTHFLPLTQKAWLLAFIALSMTSPAIDHARSSGTSHTSKYVIDQAKRRTTNKSKASACVRFTVSVCGPNGSRCQNG